MDEPPKIPKKVNITLLVSNDIARELKEDAKKHGVSVNARANEVLKRYFTVYKHIENYDCICIPAFLYQQMLEPMDEELGVGWLNVAVNELWPSIMARDNVPQTLENFINYAFGNLALIGGLYSSFKRYNDAEGNLCLLFEHKFGPKWSRMLSQAFSSVLTNTYKVRVERTMMPRTFVLRILDSKQ